MRQLSRFYLFLILGLFSTLEAVGRETPPKQFRSLTYQSASGLSPTCLGEHSVGKLGVGVGPATFGYSSDWDTLCDPSGHNGAGGEFPRHSRIGYLSGAGLWVGAVVGEDTLVTTAVDGFGWGASEFTAEEGPYGWIYYRSIFDSASPGFDEAVSDQDFVIECTDTVTNKMWLQPDYLTHKMHKPLGIKVIQKSYAWSASYAEDFVLFDMTLKNIGPNILFNMYLGLYVDGDVVYWSWDPPWKGTQYDDITGFLRTFPSYKGCGFIDTLNMAWIADNDGDPDGGQWVNGPGGKSCVAVTGVHFMRPPGDTMRISYNWWINNNSDEIYDFGPRAMPTPEKPFRDFRTGGIGTPHGDANKYYQMSNGEFDYDQAFTSQINGMNPDWMMPTYIAQNDYADGFDTRYLLSFGPFDLMPGDELPFAFAYVAGDSFHTDPHNGELLTAVRPYDFYKGVSFKDLAKNTTWADWVYDNPGVDTDSDGYAGEYRVCVLDSTLVDGHWVVSKADTSWYKGDGVPDWRAVQPPPPPPFWLEPQVNAIRVRFNGQKSETTKDIFSGTIDFEGYRIWFGRDEREASMSLLASYDLENYDKHVWNKDLYPSGDYEVGEIPYTLEQLRCAYGSGSDPCGDSTFDPVNYTHANPYRHRNFADSVFYFTRHEWNASVMGVTSQIRRVYPDAHKPGPTDTVTADDLTPEGFLKYYEYEYIINNVVPTVPYYVNVTTFDYGAPDIGLPALETSRLVGIKHCYALADGAQLQGLPPVYIYPNPYYSDGRYVSGGYEDRGSNGANPDRNRLIHFVNVPASCVIRIYTLDGDMVRAIKHEVDPSDPNSHHETWDLINRNIQTVVSGLYYWTVEGSDGKVQVGKLVIIR